MAFSRFARRGVAASVALALAVGAAGCGGDEEPTEEPATGGGGAEATGQAPETSFELTIGNLLPLTGALSPFGPPGRKAGELAAEQAQAAIEEVGADITLNVESADTETTEQAAVQAARQVISNGAGCISGPWASSETRSVGRSVAARQQVPLISPSSTAADITQLEDNGFVWRVAPSDELQAPTLVDAMEEELGGTEATLSLAARNDAYGEGLINGIQEEWEARGGTVTDSSPVLYDPEQPNYNSEAGQIVSGDPDAYVIIDFPETYARMGAALQRTGNFDAGDLFTADGLANDTIPEGVPEDSLIGARGTRPGTPEQGEVVEAFDQLFEEAGGPGRGTFDAQVFDAHMLCFLAAVAAGSGEGQAIQEQLQAVSAPPGDAYTYQELPQAIQALQQGEDINYEGVTGPIDFDDAGDPTSATYEVWRFADNGDLEVLRQVQAETQEGSG